ncbi:hypothetical protein BGZ63DRAFT_496631 [Mariannaea sp. PMI_226]|nr:hypothetical protein BGZ63DRAFT_496631 [Mariannaea sp. PMI_226]
MESSGDTFAFSAAIAAGNVIGKGLVRARNNWMPLLLGYTIVFLLGLASVLASVYDLEDHDKSQDPERKAWGGFNERPMTAKCYEQERTAMILSLFFGLLGADQFYAGHWPLAIFKLLTVGGLGLWSLIDTILWIVGGVYGTPGCPGGSTKGWQY